MSRTRPAPDPHAYAPSSYHHQPAPPQHYQPISTGQQQQQYSSPSRQAPKPPSSSQPTAAPSSSHRRPSSSSRGAESHQPSSSGDRERERERRKESSRGDEHPRPSSSGLKKASDKPSHATRCGPWKVGKQIGKGSSGSSSPSFPPPAAFSLFLTPSTELTFSRQTIVITRRNRPPCPPLHNRPRSRHQSRPQAIHPLLPNVHLRSRRQSRQGPVGYREGDHHYEVD